jgi:hypothetical protein
MNCVTCKHYIDKDEGYRRYKYCSLKNYYITATDVHHTTPDWCPLIKPA